MQYKILFFSSIKEKHRELNKTEILTFFLNIKE